MAIIDDLRAAAAAGNPNLYYSILAGAGDPYGRLALDVVNPIGFEGAAARDYANSVGAAIGVTLSGAQWFDLSIALMQQDLDAREGKYADTGSALNLSVKIIRNYHANIFGLFSLPPEAWTAEIPLRMSGYSEATWQLMLVDGGGFVGSLLKGGIIFSIVAAPFAAESQTLPQIQDAATAQAYEGEMGLASFWMHHLFTSRAWIGSAPDIQPFIKQIPDGVVIGGSSNGNEIDGGSGHDLIFGYGGQDTLNGGAGDDVVYGGAGNDTLFSSRGNDVLHGGADYRKTGSSWTEDGIDTADYSTSESGITIYLSDGDQAAKDRGEIYVRNDGFGGTDRLLSIEKILGSSKGDVILVDRPVTPNSPLTIDAGAGNDLLIGKDGAVLLGGAGADYLLADSGSVTLDGGAGNDYLEATGDGPVTYVFGRGSGHDVLGSLFVPMHQEDGWPTLTDWVEPRRNDVVKFDNLTPSDLILEWDYQEVVAEADFDWGEFSHETWRYSSAAIKIITTGDTLFLGNIFLKAFTATSQNTSIRGMVA